MSRIKRYDGYKLTVFSPKLRWLPFACTDKVHKATMAMRDPLSLRKNGASFLVKYFMVVVILFGYVSLLLSVRFPEIHFREARMLKVNEMDDSSKNNAAAETTTLQQKAIVQRQEDSLLAGLNCDRYGGPSEEEAQEMVYWKDIPSDAKFTSHFQKPNSPTQYMTFETDHAGFNNVR